VTGRVRSAAQVAALVFVAGMLALLVWKLTHQRHQPPVGSQAPEFTLPVLESGGPVPPGPRGTVTLSALRGHPVVLNFWASWCPPCKSEAPVLEKAYLRYQNRVMFVGIDFRDLPSDARTFVSAHGLKFLMLADGSARVTTGSYGIVQAPETYIVDSAGKIVAHFAGPINSSEFAAQFQAALKAVS
jgi:cytochrome c biogenesis protein CcmG/thiol:disulfide interchange protein DsbE